MPKKKRIAPKKTAARPKAGQEFAVLTVTREEIACMLNVQIKAQKSKVKRFSLSDPRLTDKVCETYAFNLQDS